MEVIQYKDHTIIKVYQLVIKVEHIDNENEEEKKEEEEKEMVL